MSDEQPQALAHAQLLEHILLVKRIAQKGVRDDIGEHRSFVDFGELLVERLRNSVALLAELRAEAQHFRHERFCLEILRRLRGERTNLRDRKWLLLDEACELHASQSLQDQMRSS